MEAWIESLGLADANYYIEWINDQVLPYSIGNYIQYPVINHNGKEYEKECVCVYIYTHTHTHTHTYMYN